MGERQFAPVKAVSRADQALRVNPPGGVFTVHRNQRGSATALGQLAYFAEYLEATGLFEQGASAAGLAHCK